MPPSILDQLEVIDWGLQVPLLKSTTVDLNQFEMQSGVKLPDSYRYFAERFGAGEMGGFYRVAVPSSNESPYELARFNKYWHGEEEDERWERYAPSEVIPRLLFFMDSIGGEVYAWNTTDVRDATANEYAIDFFPRGFHCHEVASSFNDPIENVCYKPDKDGWVARLEFAPYSSET